MSKRQGVFLVHQRNELKIYTYNKFLTTLTQGTSSLRRKENSKKKVLIKEEKTLRRILHLKRETLSLSGGEESYKRSSLTTLVWVSMWR